jgi:hypothetical protein
MKRGQSQTWKKRGEDHERRVLFSQELRVEQLEEARSSTSPIQEKVGVSDDFFNQVG